MMATTSLWRVKGYIGKVLMYVDNPEKTTNPEVIKVSDNLNADMLEDVIAYAGRESATNQRQFVTGLNCNPATARKDMMAVKEQYGKFDGTIAYHGYQSFKQGEERRRKPMKLARSLRRSSGLTDIRFLFVPI